MRKCLLLCVYVYVFFLIKWIWWLDRPCSPVIKSFIQRSPWWPQSPTRSAAWTLDPFPVWWRSKIYNFFSFASIFMIFYYYSFLNRVKSALAVLLTVHTFFHIFKKKEKIKTENYKKGGHKKVERACGDRWKARSNRIVCVKLKKKEEKRRERGINQSSMPQDYNVRRLGIPS